MRKNDVFVTAISQKRSWWFIFFIFDSLSAQMKPHNSKFWAISMDVLNHRLSALRKNWIIMLISIEDSIGLWCYLLNIHLVYVAIYYRERWIMLLSTENNNVLCYQLSVNYDGIYWMLLLSTIESIKLCCSIKLKITLNNMHDVIYWRYHNFVFIYWR